MAHALKVVRSLNSPCGLRCVDIQAEAGGRFRWSSFRRDPEDGHGWRPDGWTAGGFASAQDAFEAARRDITWLEQCVWDP